jgi:hypothetical protein
VSTPPGRLTAVSTWPDERSRNGGVDEIPISGAGRLWLCGKHFVGPDADAALERTGATVVVCLNERDEIGPRYPDYVRWLEDNAATRAVWFLIHDMLAPNLSEVSPLLDDLERRLASGEGLLVHCGAGIGRAGTLAISLLVRAGTSLSDALDIVASSRPMAGPQTHAQMEFLIGLAC